MSPSPPTVPDHNPEEPQSISKTLGLYETTLNASDNPLGPSKIPLGTSEIPSGASKQPMDPSERVVVEVGPKLPFSGDRFLERGDPLGEKPPIGTSQPPGGTISASQEEVKPRPETKNFADIQTAIKIKKLAVESSPIVAPAPTKTAASNPNPQIFMAQPRVPMKGDDDLERLDGKEPGPAAVRIISVAPSFDTSAALSDMSLLKVQKGKANIRTDFFAARLASAVDDVQSSDSDETFVYENASLPTEPKRPVNDINRQVSGVCTVDGTDEEYEEEYESEGVRSSFGLALGSSQGLAIASYSELGMTSSRTQLAAAPELNTVVLRKLSGASLRSKSERLSMRPLTDAHGSRAKTEAPRLSLVLSPDTASMVDRRSIYSHMRRTDSLIEVPARLEEELTGKRHADGALREPAPESLYFSGAKMQDYYLSSGGSDEELVDDYPDGGERRRAQPVPLRTTTSKVFDRKGSQPRRYSIIPDNVDIEDFEDELVYYDSYHRAQKANEYTQLLGSSRRAPAAPAHLPRSRAARHKEQAFPQSPQSRHSRGHHPSLPRVKSGDMPFGHVKDDRLNNLRSIVYTFVGIFLLLSIGFISGFLLATSKDLQQVRINDIGHVVVSQEELVFNMWIEAFNPGVLSIDVAEVALEIFARSEFVDDLGEGASLATDAQTILLGSIEQLLSTLSFAGGFFSRHAVRGLTEVRLLNPGQNVTLAEGGDKWSRVAKHPFELIVSGVLKYKLPMSAGSLRSVVVNKMIEVDPR